MQYTETCKIEAVAGSAVSGHTPGWVDRAFTFYHWLNPVGSCRAYEVRFLVFNMDQSGQAGDRCRYTSGPCDHGTPRSTVPSQSIPGFPRSAASPRVQSYNEDRALADPSALRIGPHRLGCRSHTYHLEDLYVKTTARQRNQTWMTRSQIPKSCLQSTPAARRLPRISDQRCIARCTRTLFLCLSLLMIHAIL